MNIIHCYTDLSPGGAAKVLINMANIMALDGHNVTVLAGDGKFSAKIHDEVDYKNLDLGLNKNLITLIFSYIKAFFKFLLITKKNKVELIFNHHRYLSPLFYFIQKLTKIKVVFIAHATSEKLFLNFDFYGDKIWAVSETVKNHFIKKLHVNQNKIEVILNAIEKVDKISVEEINRVKSELKISEKKIISCVAHFRKIKRQEFLIDAFKLSSKDIDNIILILYGFGEDENKLKNKIKKDKILDKVFIISDQYSVNQILNISDLIILTSSREGLAISLIEGMSLGKPVIGTSNTGMQEAITHNKNGYLFESNSIKDLSKYINLTLSDETNYSRLSKNSKDIFEKKFNLIDYRTKLRILLNKFIK